MAVIDVSIIIPVKNGEKTIGATLSMIYSQESPYLFEVIIIDSGSTDNTLQIVKSHPARVYTIKPAEFAHGKVRNFGAELANGKYLVYTTQDAIPFDESWLANLIRNFEEPDVAGVYGRQIPYETTNPIESFFIINHYPEMRSVKRKGSGSLDIDTIFFSDVNSSLLKTIWGKYPYDNEINTGEDIEWAKSVLLAGYTIIYDPTAAVYHSHDFGLEGVFKKYYECGMAFSKYAKEEYRSTQFFKEGFGYVMKEMGYLIKTGHIKWIPYAFIYDATKFLGIILGKNAFRFRRNKELGTII